MQPKNRFTIIDNNNGDIMATGYNILLNTGRKINTVAIQDIDQTFSTSDISGGGLGFTLNRQDKVVIAGFAIGKGAAVAGNAALPTEPLPTATKLLNGLVFIPQEGTTYLNANKIKKHFIPNINPEMLTDNENFTFHRHRFEINKGELTANEYINEIMLFVKINDDNSLLLPYTTFVFPSFLITETTSYTINYDIYI